MHHYLCPLLCRILCKVKSSYYREKQSFPYHGRFLAPDPYVQAPDFTQSFNRYSMPLEILCYTPTKMVKNSLQFNIHSHRSIV